jgi:hypothetical protein
MKTKILLLVIATLFPLRVLVASEGAAFGVGAYPLSPTTVSMWLLRTDSGSKPLPMLLVYFTGTPGWHNRGWQSKFDGNIKEEGRASYRLISQDVILEIAIAADNKTVWIQGKEFKLEQGNVYAVKNADKGSAKEQVEALGSFELPYSSGRPLALLVLQNHPELAEKLK